MWDQVSDKQQFVSDHSARPLFGCCFEHHGTMHKCAPKCPKRPFCLGPGLVLHLLEHRCTRLTRCPVTESANGIGSKRLSNLK
eukprot:311395-Amphidinium_carterae.1